MSASVSVTSDGSKRTVTSTDIRPLVESIITGTSTVAPGRAITVGMLSVTFDWPGPGAGSGAAGAAGRSGISACGSPADLRATNDASSPDSVPSPVTSPTISGSIAANAS